MMLTYEQTQSVYKWYCTVAEGDHQAKEILQSVGLISTHESEIILAYSDPKTSFLKIVDWKKFFLSKIKYGI